MFDPISKDNRCPSPFISFALIQHISLLKHPHTGGLFDPMGMSKNDASYKTAKTKEIKNGRLVSEQMTITCCLKLKSCRDS